MKKRCVMICAILLFILSFTACGKENTSGKKVLRMAYFPNITHTQALVMKSKGLLEEKLGEEYEITWTAFNAGPAEVESIFAGEIDMGYIGPVPAINAYVKSKGDVQIISNATNGGAILVTRKDLVIQDISELSGLKVAIPQLGNTQHLSLLHLLSEYNLQTTDKGGTVEIAAVANADIKSLMDQGELDAALVPEPWGSILINDIGANLVLDYNEVWREGNYPTAVVLASNDFSKENPEVVERFLEINKETTDWINNNLEEAKKLVNEEIKKATSKAIEEDILDQAFTRLIVTDEIPTEAIFDFANLNLEEGFITELPDENLVKKN